MTATPAFASFVRGWKKGALDFQLRSRDVDTVESLTERYHNLARELAKLRYEKYVSRDYQFKQDKYLDTLLHNLWDKVGNFSIEDKKDHQLQVLECQLKHERERLDLDPVDSDAHKGTLERDVTGLIHKIEREAEKKNHRQLLPTWLRLW